MEEKIFHMAGALTPQQQTVTSLERAIREAGREPVQRDSYYRPIRSTALPRRPAESQVAPASF
jgi:aminodeoxyfutalosine synthase